MHDSKFPLIAWRKSNYSGGTGNCIEVAGLTEHIGVRDSKNPEGGHLMFALDTWAAFVAEVRDGRFDLP